MGLRDDHVIDDERADAVLRRVLSALEPPTTVAPPPDLILRAASRLPASPPVAAQSLVRSATRRRAAFWCIVAPLVLLALLSLVGVVGWGTELALMIGDGSTGLSRTLLMLHLLAKPVLWVVGGISLWALAALVLVVVGGIWLWWRTVQRTPAYPMIEGK